MLNILKKIAVFLLKKEKQIDILTDYFNYSLGKFDIEFQFNITNNINCNDYNIFYIGKKELKFIRKNINKIEYDFITNLSNNKTVFVISKKDFQNNLNKLLISYVINSNSLIYQDDDKYNHKNNFLNYLKKSIKKNKLIQCNDKKILNYIANVSWRKKTNLTFHNFDKTFNHIFIKNIIRIGDGELDLISGYNIPYQEYNPKIKQELLDCINYFNCKKAIALNDKIIAPYRFGNDRHFYQDMHIKYDLDFLKISESYSANVWSIPPYIIYKKIYNYLFRPMCFNIKNKSINILSKDFYIENSEQLNFYNNFIDNKFKKILGKKIIIITSKFNEKTFKIFFHKYSNDINFIFSPEQNSFNEKENLIYNIKKYFKKSNIHKIVFIIATGPCGKILAKFIDENNYKFIDIGNFINYYNHYNNFNTIENISDIHNIEKFKKAIKSK